MNNLLPHSPLLAQALGWALLQSLWQCLLIYACLRIALTFIGKQNARARYMVSMISMAVMFAWFGDTCVEELLKYRSAVVFISQEGVVPMDVRATTVATPAGIMLQGDVLRRFVATVQPYLPLAVTIYIMGLAVMLARFGVGIYQVRRLRRKGIFSLPEHWQQWLAEKREQLFISRPVQLCYSLYAKVPVTIGTLKPVILMPIAMAGSLATDQLEAILLHELAHIKRNDYLLNILQAIAETLLFFNPFIWLTSSIVRREREHCCDDLVLAYTTGPIPYAKALAALEAYRAQNSTMALAATGNRNRLFNRIKRIMEMKQQKNSYTRSIIATLVIAAMLICLAWFSPSFAQSGKSKNKSSSKSTRSYNTPPPSNKPAAKAKARYRDEDEDLTEPPVPPEAPEASEPPEQPVAAEAPEAPMPPEAAEELRAAQKAMADVDWEKINKEMEAANKQMEKANLEMARAMKDVDWDQVNREMAVAKRKMEKANKEMAVAMANVDWDQINREMAQAQKEIDAVDWNEVNEEINKGLKEVRKSIDDPKLRKQVEHSLLLAQKQSERAMAQSRRSLDDARRSLEHQRRGSYSASVYSNGAGKGGARVYAPGNGNSNGYAYSYGQGGSHAGGGGSHETMLSKMEKDGLINRSKSYKVEKYGDRLYINGVLQPDNVLRKYSKYLNNEHVIIKGSKNALSVNATD